MEKFIWKKRIKNNDSVKGNDCKKFTKQLKHSKLQYFTVIFPHNPVNHGRSLRLHIVVVKTADWGLDGGPTHKKKDGKLFGSSDCYVSMKRKVAPLLPATSAKSAGGRGVSRQRRDVSWGNYMNKGSVWGGKSLPKVRPKDMRVCTLGLPTSTNGFSFPTGH